MRDATRLIFSYLEEDPGRGSRTRDAIIRQLEVIGEACNHIAPQIQKRYPQIPWRETVAMRHHLSHGYFQVKIKDVWETMDNDLQPLQEAVLSMLNDPSIL
ncbi:MAG: DUF86 domain-containing protein [Pseudomonadota bacterium]|nr:DUF86 domain-containing protein [Pseudomonadota bacterium]MDE3037291.1 DUF86 domain-containing protein [Pseudomonadota bacterium]